MKTIPLTKGYFTKVDDEDYEKLASVRWYTNVCRGTPRAIRATYKDNKATRITMARVIMDAPVGRYVDHINHDTLDNRKSNLRLCTLAENSHNRKKLGNKSGFLGVYQHENRWQTHMAVSGKLKYFGSFVTPEEAARKYDEVAIKYFGEFATLNFPEAIESIKLLREK